MTWVCSVLSLKSSIALSELGKNFVAHVNAAFVTDVCLPSCLGSSNRRSHHRAEILRTFSRSTFRGGTPGVWLDNNGGSTPSP